MSTMSIVNSADVKKIANERVAQPIIKARTMRFPTTKEVQGIFLEIQSELDAKPTPLMERFFPRSSTLATSIDMYVVRNDAEGYVGMTFPTTYESDVRTFDRAAKMDMAKASWSPLNFKEGKRWGEIEMIELGKLIEDVKTTQFNGQVAEFIAIMAKRMRARQHNMCYNLVRNGKIVIDESTPDNPNRLKYEIDYGVTDPVLDMPVKIDEKDGGGNSKLDPTQWINDINRAGKFNGRKIVEIITNSNFVEYLADNTFIQTLIDYDRGATTLEAVRPPRAFYRRQALEVFQRYTGVTVTLNDDIYEDDSGQAHYYFADGEALLIYGNSGPFGNFTFTGHISGATQTGEITIGTGEYMFTHDNTKTVNPYFEIIGGFNGLPQLTGYDPIDLGYHRFKWVKYGKEEVQNPPLPKRPDISKPIS